MAFVHGKDSTVKVAGTDLTTFVTDVALDQSVDVAETSTMGAEAKSYISGLSDATISITGRYDSTVTTGPDAVISGVVGGDTTTTWEFGPEGNTTGKEKYSGAGFLTTYNISAPVGDVVGFTMEIQVSGAITKATYP